MHRFILWMCLILRNIKKNIGVMHACYTKNKMNSATLLYPQESIISLLPNLFSLPRLLGTLHQIRVIKLLFCANLHILLNNLHILLTNLRSLLNNLRILPVDNEAAWLKSHAKDIIWHLLLLLLLFLTFSFGCGRSYFSSLSCLVITGLRNK